MSYDYLPTLAALAETVDTLIAIVPKTPDTHRTINREILKKLGPNGVLINVGRGWTVSEPDLIESLRAKEIAGAGLDVSTTSRTFRRNSWSSTMSRSSACRLGLSDHPQRHGRLVADNLIAFLGDKAPVTPVPECRTCWIRIFFTTIVNR